MVASGYALLPVIKHFDGPARSARVTVRNASMQGVGTKMGTPKNAHELNLHLSWIALDNSPVPAQDTPDEHRYTVF
jgi:hypothetical protein